MPKIEPLDLEDILDSFHPDNINPQPSTSIAIFLFSQAASGGTSLDWVEIDLSEYSETIDRIESLGWIVKEGNEIRLTPLGVSIAGPLYHEVAESLN